MITHVHHINFIVHDLELAIARYQKLLGLDEFILDPLKSRGVKTARIKLGETWLVLVEPLDENNIPGQYLNKHGEGFFLMSLATDDLETQLDSIKHEFTVAPPRQGLEQWSVTDLPEQAFFGAHIQLTQEHKI